VRSEGSVGASLSPPIFPSSGRILRAQLEVAGGFCGFLFWFFFFFFFWFWVGGGFWGGGLVVFRHLTARRVFFSLPFYEPSLSLLDRGVRVPLLSNRRDRKAGESCFPSLLWSFLRITGSARFWGLFPRFPFFPLRLSAQSGGVP